MWEEFKTALATIKAAPGNWVDGAKEDTQAAADWIWEVIQGDFNDKEQSTAQIATGTVISMIPLIDQVCDVRDLVANCKKINQEPSNGWYWFGLALTLIGLFPTLGSLVKGCLKIVIASARKGITQARKPADALWETLEPYVEKGIVKLGEYLNTAPVKKTLKALNIISPYGWLAKNLRELASSVNTQALLSAFDALHHTTEDLLGYVRRWGTAGMQTKVGQLLQQIADVRARANSALGSMVQPLQNWLNKVAKRLEQEEAKTFKVSVNRVNVSRLTVNAEKEAFDNAKPGWVDKGVKKQTYLQLQNAPANADAMIAKGYPAGIKTSYAAFHGTPTPVDYPAGTVLYRIVDPSEQSFDNAPWWMSKAEFDALNSKDAWRRRFAVWQNWNGNGEYVTYVVPQGQTLKGWSGTAASQRLNGAPEYTLEGGSTQILLNPANLKKSAMQKRQPTHWGYDLEGVQSATPVGVPLLENNWRE